MRPTISRVIWCALALSVFSACARSPKVEAANWANWRGPEQNGTSREKNLPDAWEFAKNTLWQAPVGGMSAPVAFNGKVFALSRVGEEQAPDTLIPGIKTQEALVALDAETGKRLWEHRENMTQTEVPFHRIGWGNPVGDPKTNRIYAQGTQGTVVCLDADTGKVIWKRQMTEEFGLISTFGGRTHSPAIDEDQLFVIGVAFGWGDHARSAPRIFCFDKNTGELRWSNGTGGIPVDAPQNMPIVAVVDGVRLVMFGAGDGGVHAFKARTGEKVWSYKASKRGINTAVICEGTRVYVTHSEENVATGEMGGTSCIDVAGGKVKEIWRRDRIGAGFSSPTIDVTNNRLYLLDNEGSVHALDTQDGKSAWKRRAGTIGKASLVLADGKLYVCEANGRFIVLRDGKTKAELVSREEVPEKMGREYAIYGSPAIYNGRIYVQAANTMYCIGPKEAVKTEDYEDETLKEEPASSSAKPAHIQVRPFDAVLEPGQKQAFTAWAFDEKGRALGKVKAEKWEIGQLTVPPPPAPVVIPPPKKEDQAPAGAPGAPAAPGAVAPPGGAPAAPAPGVVAMPQQPAKVGNLKGSVDAEGNYTAEAGPHQGGGVFAKVGELAGHARVRVLPPLPWTFDFEAARVGSPPLTWLGAGGKFAVREKDGGKVLTKLLDLDLYYRARTNFGSVDMSNYTLQADVNAGEKVVNEIHNIPDPGIINQRYVLVLLGNHQRVQIHIWPAALPHSLNRTVPFKWQANTWYTMKLRVEQLPDKAVVRGKVWPRGEAEPEAWTVELEDTTPNRNGNPGLFGHSLVTPIKSEIYYDNIIVSENK